jgi:hypothetical protein
MRMQWFSMRGAGLGCALLSVWVAACTPALNWRESNLPGTATLALFPCKPLTATRDLPLAGRQVSLHLHSCDADDAVWAVANAQLSDPALVTPALQELRAQAARHIGAALPPATGWAVPGATPNAAAGRVVLRGQLPDGRRVFEHQGLFVYGTQVFQATVIGAELNDAAVAPFFEGLRVRP